MARDPDCLFNCSLWVRRREATRSGTSARVILLCVDGVTCVTTVAHTNKAPSSFFFSPVLSYGISSYYLRVAACRAVLGGAVSCAEPRYYYASGFFSESNTCQGLGDVTTLNCQGLTTGALPNSSLHTTMIKLTNVDLSNNPPLRALPVTMASLTNITSVNLSGTLRREERDECTFCAVLCAAYCVLWCSIGGYVAV